MLERFAQRGWVKARGRQRTDSTHVLAAIRTLNRIELVGGTMRAALNALAIATPEWLRERAPEDWFSRYGRPVYDDRPNGVSARKEYAKRVGKDGRLLLSWIDAEESPGFSWLKEIFLESGVRVAVAQDHTLRHGSTRVFRISKRRSSVQGKALYGRASRACTHPRSSANLCCTK